MKIFVNILLNFCIYLELLQTVDSSLSFLFEQQRNPHFLKPNMEDYRRMNGMRNPAEYPAPLSSQKHKRDDIDIPIPSPYQSIYQGKRMPNDTRVFRRRFEFEPQPTGHHVYCQSNVNCVISHMAIETAGGIPILLRGGAGHRYFVVVAKAKPYDALTGSVRAYCLSTPDDYYTEKSTG